MKRNLTCIICPRGCALTAEISENGVTVSAKYSIDVNERDFSCVSSPELSVVSGDILSIPFSINFSFMVQSSHS